MVAERRGPGSGAVVAAALGALLLIVSPFLVWGTLDFQIGEVSETGMSSGYGWITVLLGVLVAAVLVAWWIGLPRKLARVGWLVLAVVAAGVTVYELTQVQEAPADFFAEVSTAADEIGVDSLFDELGIEEEIDLQDVMGEAITDVSYGPGLFVALAGAASTLGAAAAGGVGSRDRG